MGILEGQVALVTGCGRLKGLGRSIAVALAQAGADVAVTDIKPGGTRNPPEAGEAELAAGWRGLDSLVEELESLGRKAIPLVGDVGDANDAQRMVADAIARLGKVDILVNNAGAPLGSDWDWTWKVTPEAWDLVFHVNTRGAFLMSSAVVRHLLERAAPGRIINMSSNAGLQGTPQRAAYSATKFAIIGFTQSLASELADKGITVNAICPGAMDTARTASRASLDPGMTAADVVPPVGRIGIPSDVARTAVFLADPAASFITGAAFNVSGGTTLR